MPAGLVKRAAGRGELAADGRRAAVERSAVDEERRRCDRTAPDPQVVRDARQAGVLRQRGCAIKRVQEPDGRL
jgi:hypothetical protein